MQEVRNTVGKKVCEIDPKQLKVVIVHKHCRTTIQFQLNNQSVVINNCKDK